MEIELATKTEESGLVSSPETTRTVEYPSRCQKIGETNCLFFRWYRHGKFPLITYGPSVGPSIFLILFGLFCTGYLIFMASIYSPKNHVTGAITSVTLTLNFVFFLRTLLGDQGIKESIYLHYHKI